MHSKIRRFSVDVLIQSPTNCSSPENRHRTPPLLLPELGLLGAHGGATASETLATDSAGVGTRVVGMAGAAGAAGQVAGAGAA